MLQCIKRMASLKLEQLYVFACRWLSSRVMSKWMLITESGHKMPSVRWRSRKTAALRVTSSRLICTTLLVGMELTLVIWECFLILKTRTTMTSFISGVKTTISQFVVQALVYKLNEIGQIFMIIYEAYV